MRWLSKRTRASVHREEPKRLHSKDECLSREEEDSRKVVTASFGRPVSTWGDVTCYASEPLANVVDKLLDTRIMSVVVVDGKDAVGIVTMADITRAYKEGYTLDTTVDKIMSPMNLGDFRKERAEPIHNVTELIRSNSSKSNKSSKSFARLMRSLSSKSSKSFARISESRDEKSARATSFHCDGESQAREAPRIVHSLDSSSLESSVGSWESERSRNVFDWLDIRLNSTIDEVDKYLSSYSGDSAHGRDGPPMASPPRSINSISPASSCIRDRNDNDKRSGRRRVSFAHDEVDVLENGIECEDKIDQGILLVTKSREELVVHDMKTNSAGSAFSQAVNLEGSEIKEKDTPIQPNTSSVSQQQCQQSDNMDTNGGKLLLQEFGHEADRECDDLSDMIRESLDCPSVSIVPSRSDPGDSEAILPSVIEKGGVEPDGAPGTNDGTMKVHASNVVSEQSDNIHANGRSIEDNELGYATDENSSSLATVEPLNDATVHDGEENVKLSERSQVEIKSIGERRIFPKSKGKRRHVRGKRRKLHVPRGLFRKKDRPTTDHSLSSAPDSSKSGTYTKNSYTVSYQESQGHEVTIETIDNNDALSLPHRHSTTSWSKRMKLGQDSQSVCTEGTRKKRRGFGNVTRRFGKLKRGTSSRDKVARTKVVETQKADTSECQNVIEKITVNDSVVAKPIHTVAPRKPSNGPPIVLSWSDDSDDADFFQSEARRMDGDLCCGLIHETKGFLHSMSPSVLTEQSTIDRHSLNEAMSIVSETPKLMLSSLAGSISEIGSKIGDTVAEYQGGEEYDGRDESFVVHEEIPNEHVKTAFGMVSEARNALLRVSSPMIGFFAHRMMVNVPRKYDAPRKYLISDRDQNDPLNVDGYRCAPTGGESYHVSNGSDTRLRQKRSSMVTTESTSLDRSSVAQKNDTAIRNGSSPGIGGARELEKSPTNADLNCDSGDDAGRNEDMIESGLYSLPRKFYARSPTNSASATIAPGTASSETRTVETFPSQESLKASGERPPLPPKASSRTRRTSQEVAPICHVKSSSGDDDNASTTERNEGSPGRGTSFRNDNSSRESTPSGDRLPLPHKVPQGLADDDNTSKAQTLDSLHGVSSFRYSSSSSKTSDERFPLSPKMSEGTPSTPNELDQVMSSKVENENAATAQTPKANLYSFNSFRRSCSSQDNKRPPLSPKSFAKTRSTPTEPAPVCDATTAEANEGILRVQSLRKVTSFGRSLSFRRKPSTTKDNEVPPLASPSTISKTEEKPEERRDVSDEDRVGSPIDVSQSSSTDFAPSVSDQWNRTMGGQFETGRTRLDTIDSYLSGASETNSRVSVDSQLVHPPLKKKPHVLCYSDSDSVSEASVVFKTASSDSNGNGTTNNFKLSMDPSDALLLGSRSVTLDNQSVTSAESQITYPPVSVNKSEGPSSTTGEEKEVTAPCQVSQDDGNATNASSSPSTDAPPRMSPKERLRRIKRKLREIETMAREDQYVI